MSDSSIVDLESIEPEITYSRGAMALTPKMEETLPLFGKALNLAINDSREDYLVKIVEFQVLKKYIRIVTRHIRHSNGSAYAFLNGEGNIYMSKNWKAPDTKHIRGNIFKDPNYSYGKGLGKYGAVYLR